MDEPDVLLFTDGACSGNPGPGGWAAILRHMPTETVKKLSGGDLETTNNRMELTAAIEGLRALKPSLRCKVRLITDSEYLVNGMTVWLPTWIENNWVRGKGRRAEPVKNVDLWKTLSELCRRHEVVFEHVRGHSGHPENEECDRMAVAAIERYRH